jgi:exodeoxyribonuclease VII large subunit
MQPIRLSELNRIVKQALSQHLEPSYWLVAEVAEMRIAQAGHCYMELIEKEDQNILAKIRANIWATQFRVIKSYFETSTGEPLKAGMKILMNATIQFHEVYGISLVIKNIDPSYTLGERQRKRLEVVRQLEEDGVFDMNKNLSLPLVPQKIAIISSPTAAGYGDFMDQITNNRYGYHIQNKLFPALMQGDTAPESIIGALHEILSSSASYDLVVLIRGGGAAVDLDCFDDYELCAHIAQFPIPVITGIGHERDETVADLVAHLKLKTPTAVAEFLIDGFRKFEERILEYFASIQLQTGSYLDQLKEDLQQLNMRLQRISQLVLQRKNLQLEYLGKSLQQQGKIFLKNKEKVIVDYRSKLESEAKNLIIQKGKELQQYERLVKLSDPQNILNKGFTITFLNNEWMHKAKPKVGDTITTQTSKLKLISTIEKIDINEQK